jgi:PAS domain S-box-containing protein
MENTKVENRIKELEVELSNLKSGKIIGTLQNEISLRQAIENSILGGISVFDSSGKQVYVNPTFCNLVGWDENELLEKYPPYVYWSLQDIENINNSFQQTLNNKAPAEGFDLVFCHKTGKLIPVQVIISALIQENGKKFWLANVIDITDRKKMTEKMRIINEAVEASSEAIGISDIQGHHFYQNKALSDLLGYATAEELEAVGGGIVAFKDQQVAQKMFSIIKSGKSWSDELEMITKNGLVFPAFIHADAIKDKEGKIIGLIGVMTNISERKHEEKHLKNLVDELIIANNELERLVQLNVDKDRFISILGHDLRSPFTVLLGLSELLIENIREYNTDEIEDHLKLIKNSAQDTFALLEDLLKWISAQSGNIPFKPQTLSFADICNDILKTLNPNADVKNISINYSKVDHLTVFADADMLKTVLRNLASNAIKFTNNGGTISINAIENSSNVTISVSDNGIGISPENLIKLFDISQVLSTKGTAKETGTGLGLLLCKEFVEKHGGKIWVESEVGKGSDIKFTLPVFNEQVNATNN